MTAHHQNTVLAGGVREIARPLRDTSRWHQWRQERRCHKTTGHCWHPDGWVDWWCCMCSGETDGMPAQNCVHCQHEEAARIARGGGGGGG